MFSQQRLGTPRLILAPLADRPDLAEITMNYIRVTIDASRYGSIRLTVRARNFYAVLKGVRA